MSQSTIFICSKCDAQSPKWSGRCLECGSWGTVQEVAGINKGAKSGPAPKPATLVKLSEITNQGSLTKLLTGINEIDRVFGSGITPGSLTLISGEPGIGKSTLVAQIANAIAQDHLVIYASGEESQSQVGARFKRLNCRLDNIRFTAVSDTDQILQASLEAKPGLLIIDSIQTVSTSDAPGEAGSLTQIRASASKCLSLAKEHNIAIILIGHITKDGQIAGPKSLEHIVDTVIYLETDSSQNYRLLRTTKNRFGSTNEVGIFEMTGSGFTPVSDPSGIFLESGHANMSGSAISAIMEGTRPFLIEIQALVTKTIFGYPQRKASGFDLNRLQILTAVLSKRAKLNLATQDIILNIIGGLKIADPGLDLAVALAISSALNNKIIPRETIILGEIGLSGEIRPVARLEDKLSSAQKLGFTKAIIPVQKYPAHSELEIISYRKLDEAINSL